MERGLPELLVPGDTFDGAALHLAQRDTTFAVISRATLPEIEAFKKRMGGSSSGCRRPGPTSILIITFRFQGGEGEGKVYTTTR